MSDLPESGLHLPQFIRNDILMARFTYWMHDKHLAGVQPFRKHTGEPYATHPIQVACILHDASPFRGTPHLTMTSGIELRACVQSLAMQENGINVLRRPIRDMTFAALGHDLIEDTDVTQQDLLDFGLSEKAVEYILWCTDPKKGGTRQERLANFHAQLKDAPVEAQLIKLADTLHNVQTLCWALNDPNSEVNKSLVDQDRFLAYASEKREFLNVLDLQRFHPLEKQIYHDAQHLTHVMLSDIF